MNIEFRIVFCSGGELYNMHCGEGVQSSIEMLSLLLATISTYPESMALYSVPLENNVRYVLATQGWQLAPSCDILRTLEATERLHKHTTTSTPARLLVTWVSGIIAIDAFGALGSHSRATPLWDGDA